MNLVSFQHTNGYWGLEHPKAATLKLLLLL
jgi:hypothetical protein